jgi:hypothetical protein
MITITSSLFCKEKTLSNLLSASVERMRPFIPARDFGLSQRFYEALGFSITVVGPGIATVDIPEQKSGFLLQDFYNKELADNLMMQLIVSDSDAWWSHIQSLTLVERFGVNDPKAPALQAWGMRVAYLWDPSGVLWHIASNG